MLRIVLAFLLLALVASAAPAARAGPWRRPVDGPLLRAFQLAADPYARGQHRGVDLAAARGSPARSACAGRVSFAGRVPGGGRTVSIRCGALVASYQQLWTIAVGVGQRVVRGARIGAVGRSRDPRERRPHLHLGVREIASGRYIDPMTLLAGAPPRALPLRAPHRIVPPRALPLGAPGRIVAPRPVALAPAPLPAGPALPAPRSTAELRPRRAPRAAAPDAAPTLSWVVCVGLAAIASALPVGGLVAVRRLRRTTRQAVTAVR